MTQLSLSEQDLEQIADLVFARMIAHGAIEARPVGVSELADFLGVDKSWVYGRMRILPHFKAGKHTRFVLKDVLTALGR